MQGKTLIDVIYDTFKAYVSDPTDLKADKLVQALEKQPPTALVFQRVKLRLIKTYDGEVWRAMSEEVLGVLGDKVEAVPEEP